VADSGRGLLGISIKCGTSRVALRGLPMAKHKGVKWSGKFPLRYSHCFYAVPAQRMPYGLTEEGPDTVLWSEDVMMLHKRISHAGVHRCWFPLLSFCHGNYSAHLLTLLRWQFHLRGTLFAGKGLFCSGFHLGLRLFKVQGERPCKAFEGKRTRRTVGGTLQELGTDQLQDIIHRAFISAKDVSIVFAVVVISLGISCFNWFKSTSQVLKAVVIFMAAGC